MLDQQNFNLNLPSPRRKSQVPGALVWVAVILLLIYLVAPAIQFYLEGSQ